MNSHSSPPEPDPELRSIEEEAAEWFGRCEIGLTAEQEREFLRWLELDTRHGEAMREMDETWEYLDRLREIEGAAIPARHSRGESGSSKAPALRRVFWSAVLAAAAAITVGIAGFWQSTEETPLVRFASTEAGGMKKIDLPDGSTVHLNSSSSIEVHYNATGRRVQLLQGEAHFVVAHHATRPFIVTTGAVAVRAVGTEFNIRLQAEAVEVFVTEGKVRVDHATKGESLLTGAVPPVASRAADPTSRSDLAPMLANSGGAESGLLVAGQRALVTISPSATLRPAVVAPIAPAEIQAALAWRSRLLEFDLTPLTQVVAEFNRYNSHQLVIADPELGRQSFGGSFRADNYHVFVRLLEQRFGVTAERSEEKTILRGTK